MRKLRTAFCVALALAAGPALAADDPPLDDAAKIAIRSVISHQLDAIAHDDGSTAESFASQGIRDKFPDGPAFMAMVRDHYGALVHPKSTAFGAIEPSPHGPLQTVTIVAADGTVWDGDLFSGTGRRRLAHHRLRLGTRAGPAGHMSESTTQKGRASGPIAAP